MPNSRATADRLPRSATRTKVRMRSNVMSDPSIFRHNLIHYSHLVHNSRIGYLRVSFHQGLLIMKVLLVFAHPEPRSLNGALRDVTIRELESQGHEVRVSDLYADGWKSGIDR